MDSWGHYRNFYENAYLDNCITIKVVDNKIQFLTKITCRYCEARSL